MPILANISLPRKQKHKVTYRHGIVSVKLSFNLLLETGKHIMQEINYMLIKESLFYFLDVIQRLLLLLSTGHVLV